MKKRVLVLAATAAAAVGLMAGPAAAKGVGADGCGRAFGAVVSAAKSSGSAAHQSYPGGLPATAAAHGSGGLIPVPALSACTAPGA